MTPIELICPNCKEALNLSERVLTCENGHSFDVAREGYVNLLSGARRTGAAAGDTAEMMTARRAFLGAGHYLELAETVSGIVNEDRLQSGGVVADIGCGEGYYLGVLLRGRAAENVRAYGTDISKAAVAAAARAYPKVQFVVADTNALIPLADKSVDVLLNVFAPRNAQEFSRVVRPGGRLVIVIPAEKHLAGLRERFKLLGVEQGKAAKIAEQLAGFVLRETRELSISLNLKGVDLRNLLEMTPNAWHMDQAVRNELETVGEAVAEAAFEVLTFTRRG